MSEEKTQVYQKIAAVMAEAGTISKDKKHGQGWFYQSIETVSAHFNALLSKHKLLLLPGVTSVELVGDRWKIEYDMLFVDADSGQSVSRPWSSEALLNVGNHPDDKSMGKAHSYAVKHFLIRTFLVSAEGDVDLDASDHSATPRNWTTDEDMVEWAAVKGADLVDEFGQTLVAEAKDKTKAARLFGQPADYIQALRDYCEAKVSPPEAPQADETPNPFLKQTQDKNADNPADKQAAAPNGNNSAKSAQERHLPPNPVREQRRAAARERLAQKQAARDKQPDKKADVPF